MNKTIRFFIGLLFFASCMSSCNSDINYSKDTYVSFQKDTLHFDTAFTTRTAPTRPIKIFNNSNQALRINRLYLENGSESFFRMGVSGQTGYDIRDITLLPQDSTYVFMSAQIDTQGSNTPLYIMDRIIAETDAGTSSAVVDGYGQDAYFYTDSVIGNITWTPDKPIVLLGNVLVEKGKVLNILAGTRIYTQQGKYLLVAGSLQALGTRQDSIVFMGNRLDRDYFLNIDRPGEWGGIHFFPSSYDNKMEHVMIKNSHTAISLDSLGTVGNPKIDLKKVIIRNALKYGILAVGSSLRMENCLLHTNNINLAAVYGGDLYMNFCTLAGYSGPSNAHEKRYESKSMWLLNYLVVDNVPQPSPLKARVYNSVIYGALDEEFTADAISTAAFDAEIDHCVIRSEKSLADWQALCQSFTNNLLNQDPGFENTYDMDFSYDATSPLYRATTAHWLPSDLDDKPRSVPTDIGAREF